MRREPHLIVADINTQIQGRELRFPDGIPGFGHLRTFQLVSLGEDSVFQLLQSTDNPDISMVVVVPWLFFPDYSVDLPDDDQHQLGIERPEDAVVFSPVTLAAEERTVYVNLVGPFVVNPVTGQGRQVVLTDSDHPLRAPVSLD
jgi:flagellar assembly factor FliW